MRRLLSVSSMAVGSALISLVFSNGIAQALESPVAGVGEKAIIAEAPVLLAQATSGGNSRYYFRKNFRNFRFKQRLRNRVAPRRRNNVAIRATGASSGYNSNYYNYRYNRNRGSIVNRNRRVVVRPKILVPSTRVDQRSIILFAPSQSVGTTKAPRSSGITFVRGDKRYDARDIEAMQAKSGEGPVVIRPPQDFIYGPKVIIVSEELKRQTALRAAQRGPKIIKVNPEYIK